MARKPEVRNPSPFVTINLPVTGGGSAMILGQIMKRGATPATQNGMLVPATGAGAHPDIVGILQQAHATADDTLVNGTVFTTRPVELIAPVRIVRMRYSQATADTVLCTQAVNSTTMTVTSIEDNIDAAFLYVAIGTGAGQTNYLTASSATDMTLKAAFATNLDTTSRFIKILPRFHQLASFTSDGTQLASQAGAGSTDVMILDTYIIRNGNEQQMNPTSHDDLVGLNGLVSLQFEADLVIQDSFAYPID